MAVFQKPDREVDRVFLHCSASDDPEHDSVAVMRSWHVEDKGWSDVGYHYFIRKSGLVEQGRSLERTPAAQKGHNTGTIAICLHGLEEEKFERAQYRALIVLCREIDAAYAEDGVTFHGHCEVSSKSCPVFAYRRVLGLDEAGDMIFAPDPEKPTPSPTREAGLPTLRITDKGPAVRQLQSLLLARGAAIAVDGHFGQKTLSALRSFQARSELEPDGVAGPLTWEALQAASAGARG